MYLYDFLYSEEIISRNRDAEMISIEVKRGEKRGEKRGISIGKALRLQHSMRQKLRN